MHRQFSLQPFSRHYSHSTNPFLDLLELEPPLDPEDIESLTSPVDSSNHNQNQNNNAVPDMTVAISVTQSKRAQLLKVLAAYKAVQRAGTLHTLTFVTVNEYLWLLRAVSQEMSVLGRYALYYLAAAVSDFFLPTQKMVGVS